MLAWLLGHADQAYYLRELVRHTSVAVGAAQRELEQLAAAGLVNREVRGNQVYFQANQKAAIFPELQGLFAKTAGLVDILREELLPFADQMRAAFVFGSAARGELLASSDIDLLVIGDTSLGDMVAGLRRAEERLGREVNPTVYSVTEFQTKRQAEQHFLTSVLAGPKMFVIGGDDELNSPSTTISLDRLPNERKRNPRPAADRRMNRARRRR